MKYKLLWAIAFIAILADFGITAVAVQDGEIEESNPLIVELMDSFSVVGAMLISVVVRVCALTWGMVIQHSVGEFEILLPATFVVLTVSPVLWNIGILSVTFIPMLVL